MRDFSIRPARLHDPADQAAIVEVLDSYASDPRGGGVPLPDAVKARLGPALAAQPMARAWLAFAGTEPAGVCVSFLGFSTFHAQPLLNIHDLAVRPGYRGLGAGRALLAAAEALARTTGCCRLTLEVQDDNLPARGLYESAGYQDLRYGNSGPTRFMVKAL